MVRQIVIHMTTSSPGTQNQTVTQSEAVVPERAINRYKAAFLDKALWLGGIVALCMSAVRIQYSLLVGLVEIGFSIVTFYMVYLLRRQPQQVETISSAAIVSYWLLFMTIFVFAPYNKTRFILFFLLAAASLFLKGRQHGSYWVFAILVSAMAAHMLMPDSGYSNLDMLTGVVHTLVLLVIFDYYERLVKHQQVELSDSNQHLEHEVQQRTLELQKANEALHQEKEFLHNLSYQDQLTGLHNRHKIEEVFEYQKMQTDRYNEQFSLLLMDVDNFKQINDQHGHEVGDEVIKGVAHVLRRYTRKSDLVVRWGGDEFVILATKTDLGKMLELAEAIRGHVEAEALSVLGNRPVTVSIGVATVVAEDTLKSMLRRADDALYEAKRAGRNQVKAV